MERGYCIPDEGNEINRWASIIKEVTSTRKCQEFCELDPQCTAYEFTRGDNQCRNFYGPIKGDGTEDLKGDCEIKPTNPSK